MGRLTAATRRSSATCIASSRVGTTTRARGVRPRSVSLSSSTSCSSGIPNARVFPVPVLACPMMSCPRSASGSARAWMGKVVKMPAASRPEQIASLMPRSRNGTALVPPRESRNGFGQRKRSFGLVPAESLSCQGIPSFIVALPSGSGAGARRVCRLPAVSRHDASCYLRGAIGVMSPAQGARRRCPGHCCLLGIPPGKPDTAPGVNSSRYEQHDLWLCHSSRYQVYQEQAQPTRQPGPA